MRRLFLAIVLVCVAAFPAAAQKVQRVTSPGGITGWLVQEKRIPIIALEAAWRSYYESIFNPARVNPTVMRGHMPKKYWRNLPETQAVASLVQQAPQRVQEMIEKEAAMPRIRISSIQPQDWPDGFLELWQDPRMCRHLHLPLQSGSDTVLKRMVRRYRTSDFRALVEQVVEVIPSAMTLSG